MKHYIKLFNEYLNEANEEFKLDDIKNKIGNGNLF